MNSEHSFKALKAANPSVTLAEILLLLKFCK